MSKLLKSIVSIICFVVALVVIAVGAAFVLLDPNAYRQDISAFLSKAINRPVILQGDIKLGVAASGVTLRVNQVAVANPEWASRKTLANIASFELGVELLPLLEKKLTVSSVHLDQLDVQLETAADGRVNWALGTQEVASKTSETSGSKNKESGQGTPTAAQGMPLAVSVDRVRITNSVMTNRGKDGKVTKFSIDDLSLARHGKGLQFSLSSQLNGMPISAVIATPHADFTSKVWPVEGKLNYASYKIDLDGSVDLNKKIAKLGKVSISSGDSVVTGKLAANWGGVVPALRAEIVSVKLEASDFIVPAAESASTGEQKADKNKAVNPAPAAVMFSHDPLPLDLLKALEAEVNFDIQKLVLQQAALENVVGALSLRQAKLAINLPKIVLGRSTVAVKADMDAHTIPASLRFVVSSPKLAFEDVQAFTSSPQILKGEGTLNLDLVATGRSLHDFASTTDGVIRVLAKDGQVSLATLGDVFSGLAQFVSGGASGVVAMNCLAADMVMRGGVLGGNGLLLDMPVSTVKLSGHINLGQEALQVLVEARPKAGKIGNYMPSVRITGALTQPSFGLDEGAVAGKVVGALLGSAITSNVPVPSGDNVGGNACLEALQRPAVQQQTQPPTTTLKDVLQGGKVKPKELGKQLLRGLLGQ